MTCNPQYIHTTSSPGNSDRVETVESRLCDPSGLRSQIEELLQTGQSKKALDVLAASKVDTPWSTNAIAVCLMRLGQVEQAVERFRNLVLSGGLFLRSEIPAAWKVNFATALLMADNLTGAIQVLRDLKEEDHPSVQRLRSAIRQWEEELSLWEKIQWHLGGQPARRVKLNYPPGEL